MIYWKLKLRYILIIISCLSLSSAWINNHRLFKCMIKLINCLAVAVCVRIEFIECCNVHPTSLPSCFGTIYCFPYSPYRPWVPLTHLRVSSYNLIVLIIVRWLVVGLLIQSILYVLHGFCAYSYSLFVLNINGNALWIYSNAVIWIPQGSIYILNGGFIWFLLKHIV